MSSSPSADSQSSIWSDETIVLGHVVVDLVVGHEALRLAHRDELLLLALGVAITVHRDGSP